GNLKLGPHGAEGFRQIRYFPENGWTTLHVMLFIWAVVALVMAGVWWLDRSRAGAVLRAVGEDEIAAQSAGINITAVKVSAMTIGGVIAGIGGGIFAHYTTHIEHVQFGVVLATFAIAYPILGGLSNVFGTLLAVIFIQGFLIEGLRFMGDWRNLLFGGLMVLAMNVRPRGLLDAGAIFAFKRLMVAGKDRTGSWSPGTRQAFWRRPRGRRYRSGCCARGNRRPHWPERLGQEHDRQSHLRFASPHCGQCHLQRRRHLSPAAACACDARNCTHVPEYTPVRPIGGLAESLGCAEFWRAAQPEFCPALAWRLERRVGGDQPDARVFRSCAQA